jgi:hypothetical protein
MGMNEFHGIDLRDEGRVVQEWFNGLLFEAREEILSLVLHLESLPMGLWRRPEFATLEGDEPLSELRPDDVRCDEGIFFYRIYGLKGYPDNNSYTFLHGTDKKAKNDIEGKRTAKWRVEQLVRKEAQTHKFDFAAEFTSAPEEGQGDQS